MPSFQTSDGTTLAYTDWGDGPAVVLCHAWALDSDSWNYQLPDLVGAGFRCITYDRRGHGRSDRPGHGYDHDTLARDLGDLVDHLGLDRLSLVGHSFGCGEIARFVSRLVSRHGAGPGAGRVERVAFLAPIMPYLPGAFDPAALAQNAALLRADVPGWCAANAEPFFGERAVSPGMVEWVTRQIVDTPLMVLLATMAGYAEDFRPELATFPVPTLVVHGAADASAPLDATGRQVAELVPDCELVVIDGAGHGLYASDHVRVNAELVRFLGGAARPAPAGVASGAAQETVRSSSS
jgi:pimeloyl-ACP methyl ester carboxylesterase